MEKNHSNQIPITKLINSRLRNMKRKQVSKPLTSVAIKENVQTPLIIQDEHQVVETDPLVIQKIYKYLSSLPPGYRFKPTDVELIRDYLRPKIAKQPLPLSLIHPVNLYRFHPRTLSERYLKHPDGDEVFCYTPRDRKYKNGSRPSRGVDGIGYWKATGAEVEIKLGEEIIGYMRALTFYEGLPKTGKKTNWIMHEYRSCESRKRTSDGDMKLDDWILCKIHEKEETGPSKSKKKNEKANVNTDIDTENAVRDVNTIKDENVVVDYDEVDNLLSCDSTVEDNCENRNNCSTSYCNEQYQPNRPDNSPYLFDAQENLNAIKVTRQSGGWPDKLIYSSGPSCGNGFLPDEAICGPRPSCGNGTFPPYEPSYDSGPSCGNGTFPPYEPSYDSGPSCVPGLFLGEPSYLPEPCCIPGLFPGEPSYLPEQCCRPGLFPGEPSYLRLGLFPGESSYLPGPSCGNGVFPDESSYLPGPSCGTGLFQGEYRGPSLGNGFLPDLSTYLPGPSGHLKDDGNGDEYSWVDSYDSISELIDDKKQSSRDLKTNDFDDKKQTKEQKK